MLPQSWKRRATAQKPRHSKEASTPHPCSHALDASQSHGYRRAHRAAARTCLATGDASRPAVLGCRPDLPGNPRQHPPPISCCHRHGQRGWPAQTQTLGFISLDTAPKNYKYNPTQTIDRVPAWQPAAPTPPTTPGWGASSGPGGRGVVNGRSGRRCSVWGKAPQPSNKRYASLRYFRGVPPPLPRHTADPCDKAPPSGAPAGAERASTHIHCPASISDASR